MLLNLVAKNPEAFAAPRCFDISVSKIYTALNRNIHASLASQAADKISLNAQVGSYHLQKLLYSKHAKHCYQLDF